MLDKHAHPSTSKRLAPPRANLIGGTRLQPLLLGSSRDSYHLESEKYLNGIDDFVGLIYERLLTRAEPVRVSHRRVNTLPDNISFDTDLTLDQAASDDQEAPLTDEATIQRPSFEQDGSPGPLNPLRDSTDNGLVDDIDTLLRSFNLEELTDQEKDYLRQRQYIPNGNFPDCHNEGLFPEESQDPERNAAQARPGQARATGHGPFLHRSSQSRVDALEVAASFLHCVELVYKLSTSTMRLYHEMGKSAPKELFIVSRKLSQHAKLLHIVAESIQTSISGSLQELAMRLLGEHHEVLKRIRRLLFKLRDAGHVSRWILWKVKKSKLPTMTTDIESLQGSLLMLMQVHQTQISERNFYLLESSSA
jgi:hypothetical protein